jgi:hypothetical protein
MQALEVKLNRPVVPDVLDLGGLESPEPLLIPVDYFQGVPGLAHPEVEVGRLTGELVPVQRYEAGQLPRNELGEIMSERHSLEPLIRCGKA